MRLSSCSTPRVAYCPALKAKGPPGSTRINHKSSDKSFRSIMRAVKCLSVGRATLAILHALPNFLMGLCKERPGGAVVCFARCCGIDTLPPGDKLHVLTEATLVFGFVCVCLIGEVHWRPPETRRLPRTPTGGIVHPDGHFARRESLADQLP